MVAERFWTAERLLKDLGRWKRRKKKKKKVWIHSQVSESTYKCRTSAAFLDAERFWATKRFWRGENEAWIHIEMPKIGYVRCRKVLGCRKVLVGKKRSLDPQQNVHTTYHPVMPIPTPANYCCFRQICRYCQRQLFFCRLSGVNSLLLLFPLKLMFRW